MPVTNPSPFLRDFIGQIQFWHFDYNTLWILVLDIFSSYLVALVVFVSLWFIYVHFTKHPLDMCNYSKTTVLSHFMTISPSGCQDQIFRFCAYLTKFLFNLCLLFSHIQVIFIISNFFFLFLISFRFLTFILFYNRHRIHTLLMAFDNAVNIVFFHHTRVLLFKLF